MEVIINFMSFDKETGQVLNRESGITTIIIPATGNIYKIKEPSGDLAVEHMMLITGGAPLNPRFEDRRVPKYVLPLDEDGNEIEDGDPIPVYKTNEDGSIMVDEDGDPVHVMTKVKEFVWSPGDMELLRSAFKTWCLTVLKKPGSVVVEGNEYKDMPPADMWGIFLALFNKANAGSPFRVVTPDGGSD